MTTIVTTHSHDRTRDQKYKDAAEKKDKDKALYRSLADKYPFMKNSKLDEWAFAISQEYAAQQVAAERERIKTELKEKLNGNFKMSLQRAARIQQYLPKNEILELIDSL